MCALMAVCQSRGPEYIVVEKVESTCTNNANLLGNDEFRFAEPSNGDAIGAGGEGKKLLFLLV